MGVLAVVMLCTYCIISFISTMKAVRGRNTCRQSSKHWQNALLRRSKCISKLHQRYNLRKIQCNNLQACVQPHVAGAPLTQSRTAASSTNPSILLLPSTNCYTAATCSSCYLSTMMVAAMPTQPGTNFSGVDAGRQAGWLAVHLIVVLLGLLLSGL